MPVQQQLPHGSAQAVHAMQEFDVYSFGIMLYEMYTSTPAFASMSAGDIISAKLQNEHVAELPGTAPPALQVTGCRGGCCVAGLACCSAVVHTQ